MQIQHYMNDDKALALAPANNAAEQAMLAEITLALMNKQSKEGGLFFDMIPMKYRDRVRNMAEENHRIFKEKFATFNDFLEAVSLNWLVKYSCFERMAKDAGFKPISLTATQTELNECGIACLTSSGSYVLLTPGAFGEGAAMRYVRIPLRDMEGFEGLTNVPAGMRLKRMPSVDDVMEFSNITFSTSAVIMAFMKPLDELGADEADAEMESFGGSVSSVFASTNSATLYGQG